MYNKKKAVTRSFEIVDDLADSIERLARERGTTPRAVLEVAACLLEVLCSDATPENPVFGVTPLSVDEAPNAVTIYAVPMTRVPRGAVSRAEAAGEVSIVSTAIDADPDDHRPRLRLV